jgi:hypothetical protein
LVTVNKPLLLVQVLLEKYNKPLFAVESKRSLRTFDTLGFSLAYELGLTNVLQMLKLSVGGIEKSKIASVYHIREAAPLLVHPQCNPGET